MHERASLIRGKVEVWSKAGFGCEVELTVPASAAYAGPHVPERRVS
jgi:nitrate/nitrite-specific signal transduction histidine kinase